VAHGAEQGSAQGGKAREQLYEAKDQVVRQTQAGAPAGEDRAGSDHERMDAGNGFEAAGAETAGTGPETSGGKGSAQISERSSRRGRG
jgi:hypothetical protein